MTVECPNFYESAILITNRFLEALAERANVKPFVLSESLWSKQHDGVFIRQHGNRLYWPEMFYQVQQDIRSTEEFIQFVDALNSEEKLARNLGVVGTRFGRRNVDEFNIAFRLVRKFLFENRIENFDIDTFNSVYLGIEKDLLSDEVEFERVTPLCGFNMDGDELQLAENISIVKLSESEILRILNLGVALGSVTGGIGGYGIINDLNEYAIKITKRFPKLYGDDDAQIGPESDDLFKGVVENSIVDGLRIFKTGRVFPITSTYRAKGVFEFGVGFSFERQVPPFMKEKYQLDKSEFDEFKQFWNRKNKSDTSDRKYLDVAIRRFSQANDRSNDEDEIIDLMIASESLFLASDGGNQGELSYRLSHRAAMYLGSSLENQKYMFNFMRSAYNVRSKIVHGDTPDLPKKQDGNKYESLKDFCRDLEEYLRQGVKKAIASKDDEKKIDWDSIIFPVKEKEFQ